MIDRARVTEALARLETLLATDDTSANDLFEQYRPLLLGALGDGARQLGKQIQRSDYGDALNTLRTIRKACLTLEEAP